MLDFDTEIKKFEPIPETKDIEKVVRGKDLVDVTDILNEVLKGEGRSINFDRKY